MISKTTLTRGSSDHESGIYQEKWPADINDSSIYSESSLEACETTPRKSDRPRRVHQITIFICGILANFIVSGLGNTYGMFQLYHQENVGGPTSILPATEAQDLEKTAWIGALGGCSLNYMLAICIVPFLCRPFVAGAVGSWPCFSSVSYMTAIGAILTFLGYLGASYSINFWQLALSHGLLAGVGGGFLINPVQTIALEYFGANRGLATGMISAGAGLGGLVFPFVIQPLNDKYGIRSTLLVLGIIAGVTGLVIAAFSPPPRPCPRRSFIPLGISKDAIFWLIVVVELTFGLAALVPYAFAPMISKSLGFSKNEIKSHVVILNAVGIPARIGLGFLRDRIGSQNATIVASALLALSNLLWWFSSAETNGKALWIAYLVIWGMGTSGFNTLVNAYTLDVFGSEGFFGLMGLIGVVRGIGSLAGAPLAGVMVGKGADSPYDFERLAIFVTALLGVTVIAAIIARFLHGRRVGMKWKA
jgi:MFS family permease